MLTVNTKKLHPDATVPWYSRDGDAAKDVRSIEKKLIYQGQTAFVKTGLAFEIPVGYVMHVYNRSGQASKGLMLSNGVGVIDSNYRGELMIMLTNNAERPYEIEVGARIAQIAIDKVIEFDMNIVDELGVTNRGTDGFGSSGTA